MTHETIGDLIYDCPGVLRTVFNLAPRSGGYPGGESAYKEVDRPHKHELARRSLKACKRWKSNILKSEFVVCLVDFVRPTIQKV